MDYRGQCTTKSHTTKLLVRTRVVALDETTSVAPLVSNLVSGKRVNTIFDNPSAERNPTREVDCIRGCHRVALEDRISAPVEGRIVGISYVVKPGGPRWVEKFCAPGQVLLKVPVKEAGRARRV